MPLCHMIMISSHGGNTRRASLTSLMLSYTFLGYRHRKECFRCSGLPPHPSRPELAGRLGALIGSTWRDWLQDPPLACLRLLTHLPGKPETAPVGGNQAFVILSIPSPSPSPLASELPQGGVWVSLLTWVYVSLGELLNLIVPQFVIY